MILIVVGFLPAVWGGINHILPYEISRSISHKIAKKETDYATTRILSGIVLYPLFYGVQIYWVWKHVSFPVAAVYGGTLPMFGAFAFYYWDKVQLLWDEIQLFFMMLTRRRLIENLKQQRERLIATIDEAKEDYLKHASV